MNLLTEQAVDLRFLEISSGIRRCFDLGFAGGAKTDKSRRHSLPTRKSIFTSFIDFGDETTGNPLKKRIILSKNIIETVTLHYHFSKIDFRGLPNLCQLFMFLFMHIHSAIRLRKVLH